MKFFTADTHINHDKVILYENRPFPDVRAMNEAICDIWNSTVGPKDTVYHVGDIGFKRNKDILRYLRRLNGRKIAVWGNHDKHLRNDPDVVACFAEAHSDLMIEVPDEDAPRGKQLIFLAHFPHLIWDRCHYGAWHLHGHCHGNLTYPFANGKILDVSFDAMDFRIPSYDEIKTVLGPRPVHKFGDHHDRPGRRRG